MQRLISVLFKHNNFMILPKIYTYEFLSVLTICIISVRNKLFNLTGFYINHDQCEIVAKLYFLQIAMFAQ